MKIARTTWALLAILAILFGVTWYWEWSPAKQLRSTPTPTSEPVLLAGWVNQDIISLESIQQDNKLSIARGTDKTWYFVNNKEKTVDQGKVELLLSHLTTINAMNTAGNIELKAIGLDTPIAIITLQNKEGKKSTIKIGKPTPIDSGYYIQVNNEASIVIGRKYAVEAILELLQEKIITHADP